MPLIKVPKENRQLYTADDVALMIEKAPTLRDKSLIALYYIFGMRRNEPYFIFKEDVWVDDEWLFIRVKREKIPKKTVLPRVDTLKVSKKTRFVDLIIEHWKVIEPFYKVWFYHNNPGTFAHKVYLMVKATNINGWIHLFRHTRAERFREQGYSDSELMAWFGWLDARTPSHYVHPSRKTIEEMGSKIE